MRNVKIPILKQISNSSTIMINYSNHFRMISINPGHKPTGTFAPSIFPSVSTVASEADKLMSKRLLGAASLLGTDLGKKSSSLLLTFRVLFGIVFVCVGILNIIEAPELSYFPLSDGISITLTVCGVMLAFGLLTRGAMLCSFATCSTMAIMAAGNGVFPQMAIMWGLISLAFCLSGPGRYSLDRSLARLLRRFANS